MAPTTPKKQHLTRDQRRDILALKSSGMTYKQIVEHFLFVWCTVITIHQVSYVCLTDHATPQKRSGKPPILSLEQVAQLIAFVTSSRIGRQMTYIALSIYFSWNVGMYAIRGALRRAGYKQYIARSKPPLSAKNRANRLA
jgi:hypothetical protein